MSRYPHVSWLIPSSVALLIPVCFVFRPHHPPPPANTAALIRALRPHGWHPHVISPGVCYFSDRPRPAEEIERMQARPDDPDWTRGMVYCERTRYGYLISGDDDMTRQAYRALGP